MRVICRIFRALLISVDPLFVNYVLGRSRQILDAVRMEDTL